MWTKIIQKAKDKMKNSKGLFWNKWIGVEEMF
jgi:hypothetical protein